MRVSFFIKAGSSAILLVSLALGQGRGPGSMQGQGQGRQGQGQFPGAGNQDRARLRVHATQQQQDQYRVCSQTMSRVRKRVHTMARITATSSFNLQQARELQKQLANDLHSMTQEQQAFAESLTAEQRTANQTRLQQVVEKQRDLEFLSDALGYELEQASVENSKVQEKVRNMDQLSRSLEKQQRELADDLGVDE